MPLAIKINEVNPLLSPCIRCNTCDGFPCFIHAKADADVNAVRPAMAYKNLTLLTQAKVLRLHTNASGREVTQLETEVSGKHLMFSADIVVVACGAINSAVLLLKSANDKHPNGLANSSHQVGCNYMTHHNGVIIALTTKFNPTIFQKTLAVHDFYWGDKDFAYPMGAVQLLGNVNKERLAAHGPPFVPNCLLDAVAKHSLAWWLMTEDLPDINNRVLINNTKAFLHYTNNNIEAFNRLLQRWTNELENTLKKCGFSSMSLYLKTQIALSEVGHQCGTCCFGLDSHKSVLDLNCRTHDVDNLYIVDGSFFPSSAALNPSLTIIANALRVGEHLLERLK